MKDSFLYKFIKHLDDLASLFYFIYNDTVINNFGFSIFDGEIFVIFRDLSSGNDLCRLDFSAVDFKLKEV